MTAFHSSDREVIRQLFLSVDWIDLYELHVSYGLSPAQVLDTVERLRSADFVEHDGLNARLTPSGREWVRAARFEIFVDNDFKWRSPTETERFVTSGEPYLPDLTLIDENFFLRLGDSSILTD